MVDLQSPAQISGPLFNVRLRTKRFGVMKSRMDEAIRVTEERLKALKDAVTRERSKSRTKSPKEEQT